MDAFGSARPVLATCAYVLAYAAGITAFAVMARRRGMATDGVAILALGGLLGGAAGAQVTQLLVEGTPGKSLLGGVITGVLAVLYAKSRLGIRRSTGDLFAFAIAIGEAVGRIGCLFAGCCYGKAAQVAWAVHDHDAWRHPTQLYSSLAALVTLGVLVTLERRRTLPEGSLLYVQCGLLCVSRFAIEFWREGSLAALGLTTVQFVCIAGLAFCAFRLLAAVRRALPAPLPATA